MNWKLGRRSAASLLGAAGVGLLQFEQAERRRTNRAANLSKVVKSWMKVDGDPIIAIKSGLGSTGDIYAELGLTPMINIGGTITVMGGTLMKPEVVKAGAHGAAALRLSQ